MKKRGKEAEHEAIAKLIYSLTHKEYIPYRFAHNAAIFALRSYTSDAPQRASKKALEHAGKKGITLKNKDWNSQKQFDPQRAIFHFEHYWTLTDILHLCEQAKTPAEVSLHLQKLEVVWILKTENKLLKKTHRQNPDTEYQKAGIQLVKIP